MYKISNVTVYTYLSEQKLTAHKVLQYICKIVSSNTYLYVSVMSACNEQK